MSQVVFGLHTAEMKRWITQKEANLVKAFFNLKPEDDLTGNTYFFPQGITKIWIEEICGKSKPKYYIHLQINFARVLGLSNHAVMPYTTANISKVMTAVTGVMKKLSLINGNEKFADWTVERFDCAFDIYEQHTELLMLLMNLSVDLSNARKKCSHIPIPNKSPEELLFQSMRFGNDSYTYNIYVKLQQLMDEGKVLSQQEQQEVQYLLRLERQNHDSAVKKLLPNRTVKDLASAKVRENILKTMLDDVQLFWGMGDFYSYRKLKEIFLPAHKVEIDSISDTMGRITKHSLANERKIYTQEIAKVFASLEISPAGIQKSMVERFGVDYMEGVYHRITAQYPRPADKRPYHRFPVPHQMADGRYKANITLYEVNGRKLYSVAGRTMEEYEEKVCQKLRLTYLVNRVYLKSTDAQKREMVLKSFESLLRFRKVVKSSGVKSEIDTLIEAIHLNNDLDYLRGSDNNPFCKRTNIPSCVSEDAKL